MSDQRSASPSPGAERGLGGEDAARAVYDAFTRRFPSRVRACYAESSLADGSRLATSDIDLVIIFADGFHDADERKEAEALAHTLNREVPLADADVIAALDALACHAGHTLSIPARAILARLAPAPPN